MPAVVVSTKQVLVVRQARHAKLLAAGEPYQAEMNVGGTVALMESSNYCSVDFARCNVLPTRMSGDKL